MGVISPEKYIDPGVTRPGSLPSPRRFPVLVPINQPAFSGIRLVGDNRFMQMPLYTSDRDVMHFLPILQRIKTPLQRGILDQRVDWRAIDHVAEEMARFQILFQPDQEAFLHYYDRWGANKQKKIRALGRLFGNAYQYLVLVDTFFDAHKRTDLVRAHNLQDAALQVGPQLFGDQWRPAFDFRMSETNPYYLPLLQVA